MVQVLPKVPSFGEEFARGLGGGIGAGLSGGADFAKELVLEREKARPKREEAFIKALQDKQEKQKATQKVMDTMQRMEKLAGKPGVGGKFPGAYRWGSRSPEGQMNIGEFQSLQASLLPLFKSMFPRGMTEKEFKYIQQNYIPQPGDSTAQIQGKLSGLRHLMEDEGIDFGDMLSQKTAPMGGMDRYSQPIEKSLYPLSTNNGVNKRKDLAWLNNSTT